MMMNKALKGLTPLQQMGSINHEPDHLFRAVASYATIEDSA